MSGMFCRLAQHHVTECSERTSGDLEASVDFKRSGVIIELVRMRDFCFVLRDRAKTALDAAWVGREGYSGVESSIPGHDLMEYSSQESLGNPGTIDSSVGHHGENQAAFVQSFEETFQEKATLNGAPQYWTSQLSAAEPISLETATRLVQQQTSSFGSSAETNVFNGFLEGSSHNTHESSSNTVEGSRQDEGGMWNWWDMIDMDTDGNRMAAA
jgi:hypothetical protein